MDLILLRKTYMSFFTFCAVQYLLNRKIFLLTWCFWLTNPLFWEKSIKWYNQYAGPVQAQSDFHLGPPITNMSTIDALLSQIYV